MTDSLYGSPIFIGRKKQINTFLKILETPNREKWILCLTGGGGIGKTKLMEQFIVEARKFAKEKSINLFCTEQTVDFYWAKNNKTIGILTDIAEQLSSEIFTPFLKEIERRTLLDSSNIKNLPSKEKVIQAFIDCYKQLGSKGTILLLFDTLELCEPWVENFWVEIMPHLSENTVVILAGRYYISDDKEAKTSPYKDVLELLNPQQFETIALDYFDPELVEEYLAKEVITTSLTNIKRIWELSSGKPILIALICDWVRINGRELNDLIAKKDIQQFQTDLVAMICDLSFGQDQAILAMAHFYRRFNQHFLAHIFNQDLFWAEQVVAEISRYSFVKHRKSDTIDVADSVLLHDEMRRLIENHVWGVIDPSKEQRRYWSQSILSLYDKLINDSKDHADQFILKLEKLHYLLEYNVLECHEYICDFLRERAGVENDLDVRMIVKETDPYITQLGPIDADTINYYKEWVNIKTTGEYTASIANLKKLAEKNSLEIHEESQLYHWLIAALAADSQLELAKTYAAKALKILEEKFNTFPKGFPEYQFISEGIGGVYNSLGLISRREGDFKSAIEYYECALDTSLSWAFRATVENNLSFALMLSGNARRAEKICRRALNRRLKLGVPNELGLNYNVLGVILTDLMENSEAYSCFEKSQMCFQQAKYKRGEALALIGMGRLLRKWGEYKERRNLDTFNNLYEKHYGLAIEKLSKARAILIGQDDDITLAEALDELGCAYREGKLWIEAIECLGQAYEIFKRNKVLSKMADTLANLAITYQNQQNWEQAQKCAEEAEDLARQTSSFYIFSKIKWTMGDVAYAKGNILRAFREYSQAGVLLAQPSADTTMYDSRGREMLFDNLVTHLKEQVFKLKSYDTIENICEKIYDDWSEVGLVSVDEYKEFLFTVKSWPEEYLYASQQ